MAAESNVGKINVLSMLVKTEFGSFELRVGWSPRVYKKDSTLFALQTIRIQWKSTRSCKTLTFNNDS